LATGVKALEPEIDKVGAEGHKKGLRKPRDYFWDLHPGKKLAHRNEIGAHRLKLEKEREEKEKKEEKKEEKKWWNKIFPIDLLWCYFFLVHITYSYTNFSHIHILMNMNIK